ncbi:unnamed protein product [Meloidogyne enterolobii]|uniref:Uncharacterized protein n=1 Tax=Meloidogyne enterolobii TaxID=390850 RepID=A0ACB0XWL7_MELEN
MQQIYTREIILNTFQKEVNKILVIPHTNPEDINLLTIQLTHTKEGHDILVIQDTHIKKDLQQIKKILKMKVI